MFYGCKKLKYISIPGSVTSIGEGAFYGCPALADRNGMIIFRDILFQYTKKNAFVVIPDHVKTISKYAFDENQHLINVTIPSSVTHIGYVAFYKCTNLQTIKIPPSVKTIGESAFEYCKNLEITIPNSATVGNRALLGCKSVIRY